MSFPFYAIFPTQISKKYSIVLCYYNTGLGDLFPTVTSIRQDPRNWNEISSRKQLTRRHSGSGGLGAGGLKCSWSREGIGFAVSWDPLKKVSMACKKLQVVERTSIFYLFSLWCAKKLRDVSSIHVNRFAVWVQPIEDLVSSPRRVCVGRLGIIVVWGLWLGRVGW